jgi:DNA-binding CsgD family transcriptional regulator
LLSDLEWETAQSVCTTKQLAALNLWRRGYGTKRIALQLDLDPSTARYRVAAAKRRIVHELERLDQVASC